MNLIKTKVASGEINGGDKLLSVREFSKNLKVNPNTIQRAYQELEREGLVFTQRGMGTFVSEDTATIKNLQKSMAMELVNKFLTEMKNLGLQRNEIRKLISQCIDEEEKK